MTLLTRSWQTQAHRKKQQNFTLTRILYLQTVLRLDKFASCAVWNKEDTAAEIFKCSSEVCEIQYRLDPPNVLWLQSHKMESVTEQRLSQLLWWLCDKHFPLLPPFSVLFCITVINTVLVYNACVVILLFPLCDYTRNGFIVAKIVSLLLLKR